MTRILVGAPFIILGGSFLLLFLRPTRGATLWMLGEDRIVEQLTFVFLLAGGLIGLRLALALRATSEAPWIRAFHLVFGLCLILVAMEEISWGQRLLEFDTPASLRSLNYQGETTLHNLGALQGRSEWMRLGFGLGGLVGIGLSFRPALAGIGAPMILLPWFLVITGHAAVDALNDLVPIDERFDFAMQRTSEVVELLIGIAAFLYTLLAFRRLLPSVTAQASARQAS